MCKVRTIIRTMHAAVACMLVDHKVVERSSLQGVREIQGIFNSNFPAKDCMQSDSLVHVDLWRLFL